MLSKPVTSIMWSVQQGLLFLLTCYMGMMLSFFAGLIKEFVLALKNMLNNYGLASGYIVNLDKSSFFSTNKATVQQCNILKQITGFGRGYIPFQYLGVPIFQGVPKTKYFQEITNKAITHLQNWKGRMLSMMSRIQMVNSGDWGNGTVLI